MKVGLVSYNFINNDIKYNLKQIRRACEEMSGKVDFLVFGEAFLQGFDALVWDYEIDKILLFHKIAK